MNEPIKDLHNELIKTYGGEADFVCNSFVMYEKALHNPLSRISRFRASNQTDLIYLIFICLVAMSFLATLLSVCAGAGNQALFWFALGLTIFGACTYSQLRWLLKPFPTNVICDEQGIRLAWRFRTRSTSFHIPWRAISRLSASNSWSGSGLGINIDVMLSMVPASERLPLILQTCSLWARSLPLLTGAGSNRVLALQMPLDSLTREADQFRLIAALKGNVDPLVLSPEFNDLLETGNAPTFTKLWLDDMQSFRRDRIDELTTGAELQSGRYIIQEKIATGGQAKIYCATDNHQSKAVAVKELVLPIHAGPEVRNRAFGNVKNEALMLSSLDHPGIIKLLDNFVEDHRAYLILEHISGTTLRRLVQEKGELPALQVAKIALQIAAVLEYLHSRTPPVVHRDLTPDNVMKSDDDQDRITLLDFNVAQQLESDSTKTVVGKHNYMAPEQFKGKPCPQSDLYSLGCTLHYLLTGVDPVPLKQSNPQSLKTDVPNSVDNLVKKLTAFELAERYQCASDLSKDLAEVIETIDTETSSNSQP